ncbi:MAG TPA: pyridoxal 5'-phosphate synthase glutaminase subunit PdxT [Armatimonadota bacterium]|jgi:5'-phosphate synthase pdxT subunit
MEADLPIIGVLDLQGAVQEHVRVLERLGVPVRRVRLSEEIEQVDGLIIPGGESTTVGKLLERRGMDVTIRRRCEEGMAVFGTCMGLIMLAQRIEGSDQQRLGLMDIGVRRNAFGRQVDSFEADLTIPALGSEPVPAVFIRAPIVTDVGADVEVIAEWDGVPVAVRQGRCLGAAFHPELTDDTRFHAMFVAMAGEERNAKG